jgi:hypothetical protein
MRETLLGWDQDWRSVALPTLDHLELKVMVKWLEAAGPSMASLW